MTQKAKEQWLFLIRGRSTTCLRNFLKEPMYVGIHDMVTQELEAREV
jgi:hypothetical protein